MEDFFAMPEYGIEDMLVPDKIETIPIANMTKKTFYRDHLTASVPVLLEGMAREWPAFTKWQNETYLREMTGEEIIHCEKAPRHKNEFAYFDK
jgi:hypothetical protein